MPSSYTQSLRLILPVTGELTGTWGDAVNAGLTELVEDAIAGSVTIAMADANVTLTTANEAADQARNMFLNLTGAHTAQRDVIVPAVSKLYFVNNGTTGGFGVRVKTSAGAGVVVPNGRRMALYCDGTDVLFAFGSSVGRDVLLAADAAAARATLGVREANETWQPGDVKWQAHGQESPGWLLCDGAAISRTTYAALFNAIGTTWGAGDGSTTFNVPNLQSRMAIGAGPLYGLGATGGSKDAVVVAHTHTGTTNNDGNHAHTLNGSSIQGGSNASPSAVTDTNSRPLSGVTGHDGAHSHAFTTASAGVSGTDANLPPYAALRAVIKA